MKLDNLLHQELRLAIVSFLMQVEWANFKTLLKATEASKGNLSVQLSKLKKAGYVEVKKSFKDNYPLTEVRISKKGKEAMEVYILQLKELLKL